MDKMCYSTPLEIQHLVSTFFKLWRSDIIVSENKVTVRIPKSSQYRFSLESFKKFVPATTKVEVVIGSHEHFKGRKKHTHEIFFTPIKAIEYIELKGIISKDSITF